MKWPWLVLLRKYLKQYKVNFIVNQVLSCTELREVIQQTDGKDTKLRTPLKNIIDSFQIRDVEIILHVLHRKRLMYAILGSIMCLDRLPRTLSIAHYGNSRPRFAPMIQTIEQFNLK